MVAKYFEHFIKIINYYKFLKRARVYALRQVDSKFTSALKA